MRAKVWNDNIYPHKEYFKGETFIIPPQSFIEMDYDEAILFRGQFSSIRRDADGQPTKESFKMIRIEPMGSPADNATKPDPNKCQACAKTFANQGELAAHIFDVHPEAMAPESKDEAVANLKKISAQGKGK